VFPAAAPARCRDQAPDVNPGDALCQAGKLEVHCVMGPPRLPCPETYLEAAMAACETDAESYRIACNACGGATVELPGPFYSLDLHYDAAGELSGVTLNEDDPVGPCEQREFVFGRHCSLTERRESHSCRDLLRVRRPVIN
jgi:hypothetical protein